MNKRLNRQDMFDEDLAAHMNQLSDLLGSNLTNKEIYVDGLIKMYPNHEQEIGDAFSIWNELENVGLADLRPEMDVAFYKMLNNESGKNIQPVKKETVKIIKWLTLSRLAIAATFVMGLAIGQWLDIGNTTSPLDHSTIVKNERGPLSFASIELTPSPFERIRDINEMRTQESLDLKILAALNKTILNDPNVNVRLAAIGTMVLFADMPEARTFLVKAIPYQQSSIVQLELADIMIFLEEKSSADEWHQLLKSDQLESDVRVHLKENLKTIL